jgi:hypothetical protein
MSDPGLVVNKCCLSDIRYELGCLISLSADLLFFLLAFSTVSPQFTYTGGVPMKTEEKEIN